MRIYFITAPIHRSLARVAQPASSSMDPDKASCPISKDNSRVSVKTLQCYLTPPSAGAAARTTLCPVASAEMTCGGAVSSLRSLAAMSNAGTSVDSARLSPFKDFCRLKGDLTRWSIAIVPLVFAALASAQGPCYNQADPDNGIGNYCYCEGNGLCYTNPQGQCNPVGTQINCPE